MDNSHFLSDFFEEKGYLDDINSAILSGIHIDSAKGALSLDKDAFFVNGMVTFASIINSLNKSNYSWAFINSYYCIFYLARTFVAINDYSIVYANRKPYLIKIHPNERFTRLNGNSHEVVLNLFKNLFPMDILIRNDIAERNPLDWFKHRREIINYKLNPFSDPIPPIDLYNYGNNIRNWISSYISDSSYLYTFSTEHAYLAYPIKLLLKILDYYEINNKKNIYFNDILMKYLRNNIADDRGPFTVLLNKFEMLC